MHAMKAVAKLASKDRAKLAAANTAIAAIVSASKRVLTL